MTGQRSLYAHVKPNAGDVGFMGHAMMTGARAFLFGTERSLELLQEVVARYRPGVIALPRDIEILREILRAGTESIHRPRESTVP